MKAVTIDRKGTAAVEASLMMPVLLFIFLGAIDVAQYINVSQVISNASREGAMIAVRNSTTDEHTVETAVYDYLVEHYPMLADSSNTLDVTIERVNEESVDGNWGGTGFDSAEAGDAISVTVSFDFANVRWIPGPQYWSGPMTSQTISRKQ